MLFLGPVEDGDLHNGCRIQVEPPRMAKPGQILYLPLVVNCISQEGARVKSWVRVGLVDYVQGQPVTFIEHCMQGGGGQPLYGSQLRFLRIW